MISASISQTDANRPSSTRMRGKRAMRFKVFAMLALLVMLLGLTAHGKPAKPESCTIFTASYGDTVLFGNNEDWINPNTYYWVIGPKTSKYGGVYFGFDNRYPQGGINEKGLAFDWNALPEAPLNPHPELRPLPGKPGLWILERCATVQEAIDLAKQYAWGSSLGAQLHLADATGDAVVISAGPDGELAFTRKQTGDGQLVSTNFNLANPKDGGFPCRRYDTATAMLENIEEEDDLTVDYVRSILDAVHQEGASVNTVYSNVFDLRNGLIYLYHWHQFDEVVTLNVAEEVARSGRTKYYRISDHFSQQTVDRATKDYLRHQGKIIAEKNVAWVWLLLTTGSLAVLIWDSVRGTPAPWGIRLVWTFITAIFGPFGLMAYLLSYRQPLRSAELQTTVTNWQRALAATSYSMAGYAVVWTLGLAYFVYFLPDPKPMHILVVTYVAPLIIGLLAFRAPLAASRLRESYRVALRRTALTELISVNLAFAGMLPVLLFLVERWFPGPPDLSNPLLWFMISLAAIAGALVVYPLNAWLARRRSDCLPVWLFAGGAAVEADKVVLPSLRNAWAALLLSFALSIASLGLTVSNLV